jgi:hypothetical protein
MSDKTGLLYDIRHKDIFYGRGAASEQLAARVLGRPVSPSRSEIPPPRFIVVTGPSGIGNSNLVTRGDYDALQGGATGSLRVRANQIVDGVDKLHGETARRVLERLVSVEDGAFARCRVQRREVETGDPEENARVAEVLRRLDEARLIVTDGMDKERYLELAHDALILGWDRLLNWVHRDAALIALRRLTLDVEEWSAS